MMKNAKLLAVIFLCMSGCDAATRVEPISFPTTTTGDHDANSNTLLVNAEDERPEPCVFKLSEAALPKVRSAMEATPEATHLVVIVDFDATSCTGFRYHLGVDTNPSEKHFVMLESSGIKVAIEKKSVKFLNGTTLDYSTPESGPQGFLIRNPNVKESSSAEPSSK
jgi:iron-sulfur cluster assembly protein